MFQLDDNEQTLVRNWPVIINVPQDGGTTRKREITADYLLLPQDEQDELLSQAQSDDGKVDAEILRRVVKGIGGVADAEGKPIEYSPELLERLMQKAYIRLALINTYLEATAGQKAKRKN